MKRRMSPFMVGCLITLGIVVLGCLALFYRYIIWPWPYRTPERHFSAGDWLLTLDDLPPGWEITYDRYVQGMDGRGGTDHWSREFILRDEQGEEALWLQHYVTRFENFRISGGYYHEAKGYDTAPYIYKDLYIPPEVMALFQPHADEWYFVCSSGGCSYGGRYEEYHLSFNVSTAGQAAERRDNFLSYVSYELIADWLRLMDERAARALGKTQTPANK